MRHLVLSKGESLNKMEGVIDKLQQTVNGFNKINTKN